MLESNTSCNDFVADSFAVQAVIELTHQTQQELNARISELAELSPIEYDQKRKDVAKELGIQLSTLDSLVKAARKDVAGPESLMFEVVMPSSDPVIPADLFDELAATIQEFIVLDKEQACAMALWIAMTWVIDAVKVSPMAIINAPEKSCGKTQLLEIAGFLSRRPLPAANISTAGLFRVTEQHSPTILIDEADTFIRENQELKGLFNAGHTRSSAFVIRVVGENHEPKRFNIFGAKAIAGISLEKHLPDATMSRGIIFVMRRKLPHESVKRLRHAEEGLFAGIQAKLARFAVDYFEQVKAARPNLPDELGDRAQDNWEPLLSIAHCAGPEWVQRATEAALKLSVVSESSMSISTELLMDIQYIFESNRVEKISTASLIEALIQDEERPWASFNHGKAITPRQLASQLAKYNIHSKTVRMPHGTPKGFDLGQFEETFARYLSTATTLPQQSNVSPEASPAVNSGVAENTPRLSHEVGNVAATPENSPIAERGGVADVAADFLTSLSQQSVPPLSPNDEY